ncbi:hypothetical protein ACIRRH_41595 [Kitasatospora sp. NPDC101235]|uniref:hypothetical protein n=1 Tax=Kitasatospora sp. NPDC101235 TaxID=3364101 RepID=UPI00380438DE
MFVFVCAGCGAELTIQLSQVALPVHAYQKYGNGTQLPVLMEPGTFAMDPEPSGPPWRRWEEIDPDEATARGFYAPVYALSDGAPGAIAIAPGDARGTVLIPERSGGYCCGLDGADGPNMACGACGLPVASRIDDCSLWQAVWLAPDAVRRLPVEGAGPAPLPWEELMEEGEGAPPFEPIRTWGSRWGTSHYWSWSPQWEAAAGRALAHLLAASQGVPVTVPDGLIKEVFQRALDALLPAAPSARRAVLAGPGQPVPGADADILLVPTHPQTGEVWTAAGSAYLGCGRTGCAARRRRWPAGWAAGSRSATRAQAPRRCAPAEVEELSQQRRLRSPRYRAAADGPARRRTPTPFLTPRHHPERQGEAAGGEERQSRDAPAGGGASHDAQPLRDLLRSGFLEVWNHVGFRTIGRQDRAGGARCIPLPVALRTFISGLIR